MDFHKKYVPTLETIVGEQQKRVATLLLDKLQNGEVTQKVMLLGSSGIGKTSIAKIYANALAGDNSNAIIHINCIDKSGIGDVRELLPQIERRSMLSPYSVFILDEIHGWSGKAQEGLLTLLEDLPEHAVIIAASTAPEKLTPTLKSRFSTNLYHLQPPTRKELAYFVMDIFKQEGVELDKEVGKQILDYADGNVREVVGYCQQAIEKTLKVVDAVEPETNSLLGELLSDKPNLPKISECELTNSQLVGICKWAMQNMKNPKAVRIIEVFGGGLSQTMPEDVAFMNLVVKYCND